MGYLERVFLGSLLLFALVILFMFGLYFDLGNILQGIAKKSSEMGGGFDRSVERLERSAVRREITAGRSFAAVTDRPVTRGAGPSIAQLYQKYSRVPPPPTVEDLMEIRRKELVEEGFGDEYVKMEVLGMDRTLVHKIEKAMEAALAAGDPEEAASLILEAISETDPDNLYVLQQLYIRLGRVYYNTSRLDEYQQVVEKLYDIEESILDIKESSKLAEDERIYEEIQKKRARVEEERRQLPAYIKLLEHQKEKAGGVNKLTEDQRDALKAQLVQARDAGEITQAEMDEILGQVDDMGGIGF